MTGSNPYTPENSQREEILDDIRRVGNEQGSRITREIYTTYGNHSITTVQNYVGTFTSAIRDAGCFPANPNKNDCIRAVEALSTELERVPTSEDMDEHGVYSYQTIVRHLDSWKQALESAGFDQNDVQDSQHNIPTEHLLNELQRLTDTLGEPPSQNQIDEEGEYAYTTYHRRFGSLAAALQEAGIEAEDAEL